jgi:hypothetical protein
MLAITAVLAGSTASALFAQNPDRDDTARAKARAKAAASDSDVTYGRVKELVAGQKVVIDVDNAPDKTFELSDRDVTVKLGRGLKVGDPVKVSEHEVAGKTKSVTISKHSGGGVAHGDKDPAAKKP